MNSNYRVLRILNRVTNRYEYGIRRVYYSNIGRAVDWSNGQELVSDYNELKQAFNKPVLEVVGNELVEVPVDR